MKSIYSSVLNVSSHSGLPNQKLTKKQKIEKYGSIEDWYKTNMNSIEFITSTVAGVSSVYSEQGFGQSSLNAVDSSIKQHRRMLFNLNAFEKGIFNTETYCKIFEVQNPESDPTATFKNVVKLEHHDCISPYVERVKNEKISRPFNFYATDISEEGINSKNNIKLKLVLQLLNLKIKNAFYKELQNQGVDIGAVPEEEIVQYEQEFFKDFQSILGYKKYNAVSEKVANALLKYWYSQLKCEYKFNFNFLRFLATGRCIYRVGIENGKPFLYPVNPAFFDFEINNNEINIENSSYYREYEYLSISEIIRRYHKYLTDDQIDSIENLKGIDSYSIIPEYYTNLGYFNGASSTLIKVSRFEWKGMKKIGIMIELDEEGNEFKKIVEEDYIPSKTDKNKREFEWYWIPWTYTGMKIGNDIYFKMEELEYQQLNPDNLDVAYSSYTGVSNSYSLADKILTYQYLYNVEWYKIKVAQARSNGKVLLIDVDKIPNQDGWGIEQWLTLLKEKGIAAISTTQTDINGERSNFNQFQSLDMTSFQEISGHINVLNYIRQSLSLITGVSDQALGQIKASETLGGVNESIAQSQIIIENYFYQANESEKLVLQKLVDIAKFCVKEGDYIPQFLDELTTDYCRIEEDFFNSEYGVYVENSAKHKKILEMIKQISLNQLQSNQISLEGFIKINRTESLALAEHISNIEFNKVSQERLQQLQAQQEMEKQKLDFKKYEIDENNKTKIKVAEIMANAKGSNDNDANNNEVSDTIDLMKITRDMENTKYREDNRMEIAKMQNETKIYEIEVENGLNKSKPSTNKTQD
jgi:hypothetical protein